MNSASFDLQTISNRIFRFWWILILGGIIGALIGVLINKTVIKPIYVADSTISVLINFKEVGHLSQYEQDQLIGQIKSLFKSTETINQTILEGDQLTQGYDQTKFFEECFLEQNINEIVFRCQNSDPIKAANLSNIWSKVSFSILENAFTHARIYQSLNNAENALENCIELSALIPPTYSECNPQDFSNSSYTKLSSELNSEYVESKGVFPGISFTYGTEASIPKTPVRFQTNTTVLISALAGMIISFLIIMSHFK